MSEDNLVSLPHSGLRARLKAVAEGRYQPQPLDLGGEWGVMHFRRLTGRQLDELSRLQQDNPRLSVAEHDSRVAAMALVADEGNQLTWEEFLELGPTVYTPAKEFVMDMTVDLLAERTKKEAGNGTKEPVPFLYIPTSLPASAANGDGVSSKSTTSRTTTPK